MGSKRYMLSNGLGTLIKEQSKTSGRLVDLFCGSGSVAWFAAGQTDLPVLAVDLQLFSSVMALSVIGRTEAVDVECLEKEWLSVADKTARASSLWKSANSVTPSLDTLAQDVHSARDLCATETGVGPIWNAYGGHYFSPVQALIIDYLIDCLPSREPERTVCHAAVISAASRCAAAPGHTAQPFQPTKTAGRFLLEAWERDPISYARQSLRDIGARFAKAAGTALVADALDVASDLEEGDLVVVDPPYSGVQYSRFYHVLETVAAGDAGQVFGRGRYPALEARPQSDFSKKSESKHALRTLLTTLSSVGCRVILTFPSGESSNGLSGSLVIDIASKLFDIDEKCIHGSFSTLGGSKTGRSARMSSSELVLLLTPKG